MIGAQESNRTTRKHARAVARLALAAAAWALAPAAVQAQTPSVLYTWPGTAGTQEWFRAFGTNTATLSNSIDGELTITETGDPGSTFAFSDGFNRVRETPQPPNGGLDLTGLEFLEFDFGHNGIGAVNVQFYTQATPSSTYRALGPDIPVFPGIATYQLPLSGLTPDELVYMRTIGINIRSHVAEGNLEWTLREVRSVGTPLQERVLITHDNGTVEGGLQGAIVNFDNAAVVGNNGQNQTGLSHNPSGSGSLQWTDAGGGPGAAISWGNGTAWNGNGFNYRTTDLSGYSEMIVRMSATDPLNGGGAVGVQGFFQVNGFSTFQAAGPGAQLPIDGQFHDLKFPTGGLVHMNVVDTTGINVFAHPQDLTLNVDNIRFRRLQEQTLFSWEGSFEGWAQGPEAGHVHSLVSTGATHGTSALQIDRSSVRGNGSTTSDDAFVPGSIFTTTTQAVIADLVPKINNAEYVAFDVTFQDQFPANPSFTNFYVAFDDHTGEVFRGQTAGININGALPGTTRTLQIPIENFVDATPGSTKTLATEGLSPSATRLDILLISNTDYGAVYQIDNFRLVSEIPSLTADFNDDGFVTNADLEIWKTAFDSTADGDADGDGDSDGNDFLAWQRQVTGGGASAVPEPSTLLLAAIAAAALRRRRG
jgi:hypothetical protein